MSGGIDSTVLLYEHLRNGDSVHCVLFHYGQTHYKELDFARRTCRKLEVPWTEVELSHVFGKSALIDGDGSLVVPNRNAVMLNIAVAIAVKAGAQLVTYACNREDRKEFPDCRPSFLAALNETLKASETPVEVCAPYSPMSKRDIVKRGREMAVPFDETWSCYKGWTEPCGTCPACILRQEAMA